MLGSGRGAELLTTETHHIVFEHRYSMTAQGLIDILPGMPFYLFVANLTANRVNVPKFMIVALAFNAFSCIIQAHNDGPCLTKPGGQDSTR